jgi:putative ABC transport system substrate-binding protein
MQTQQKWESLSRRAFVGAVMRLGVSTAGLALLGGCELLSSDAGRSARVPRVGALFGSSPDAAAPLMAAIRQGLRDYGYVEPQNILIEWRFAEGHNERFPELAAELVRLPVDLLLIPNSTGVAVAKQVTRTISIVMTDVADPVGSGLVTSLAQPGANVTGFSEDPETATKRLELLRDVLDGVLSGMARVAVLRTPAAVTSTSAMDKLVAAAESLNVEVLSLDLYSPEDVEGALESALRARADALLPGLNPVTLITMRPIVEFAAKHRLPAMYPDRRFVDAGGLMAYGANRPEMYRRTGAYIDRILKGAKPADLPVQLPTVFDFVVNVTAAQALGLTIPRDVAAQVTEWVN